MATGPNMLAYTIKPTQTGDYAKVVVGQGSGKKSFDANSQNANIYWWYFLSNQDPHNMVHSVTVPGSSNTTVPSGIDTYMNNPDLLFGVVTQQLNSTHLPQGPLFDYLVSYGAGNGLRMLEQANATLGCGYLGTVTYALIGQAGPRGPYPPASYEAASLFKPALLQVSLMSLPNGQPPYSIIETYTF